jgi:predicted RNA polymerase sigma factor
MDAVDRIVAHTFRQEADRILASLISAVRDFELAQDALQDALLVALESWEVIVRPLEEMCVFSRATGWSL